MASSYIYISIDLTYPFNTPFYKGHKLLPIRQLLGPVLLLGAVVRRLQGVELLTLEHAERDAGAELAEAGFARLHLLDPVDYQALAHAHLRQVQAVELGRLECRARAVLVAQVLLDIRGAAEAAGEDDVLLNGWKENQCRCGIEFVRQRALRCLWTVGEAGVLRSCHPYDF